MGSATRGKRKSKSLNEEQVPDVDPVSSDEDDESSSAHDDYDENPKKNDVDNDINDNGYDNQALKDLVNILTKPEDLIHSLLYPPQSESDQARLDAQVNHLRSISKTLFSRMEKMAHAQEKVNLHQDLGDDEDEIDDACPLSGLTELYTGENESGDSIDRSMEDEVDAETIWGQVDLQNEALFNRLRKNIRKLEKKVNKEEATNAIRLIDLDSDDEQSEDQSINEGTEEYESNGDIDDENDSEEDDDDARRMRERMEKAMADMEDDESIDEEQEQDDRSQEMNHKVHTANEIEEDLVDPAAEELNDGFFDLHEMEAFADEEEEMLPDEAYGEIEEEKDGINEEQKKKNDKQKLPHFKSRKSVLSNNDNNDSDSSSEDEEFNQLEKQVQQQGQQVVRRKRYRKDEEVNALLSLYESVEDDNEDSDEDDVINMTAADFFGKPNKKYYKARKNTIKPDKTKTTNTETKKDNDDNDSWDEYDFEDEAEDWRNENNNKDDPQSDDIKEQDSEKESDSDDEGESDNDNDEDEEDAEKDMNPSNYQKHAQKLEKVTEELEKEMISAKKWQMVGESKATERPTNSLLEKTPQFEIASKMAPLVTAEHSEKIEDIIKRRIFDEDWDDLIPREFPDIGQGNRDGELPEVSQEKSKLGLGELYEREYLKKVTGYDKDAEEKQTEEDQLKSEMKAIFANLCSKLDALSNYHFAPRPVADEADVKVITTPAIAMEEALPTFVSDARAVAPEEVYGQKKGRESVIRGESEMDQAERKRLRQAKKTARRKKRKAKLADEKLISKLQPGLGLNNPYEKRKMREELQMARASGRVTTGERDTNNDYTSSTKFFERMQEDVQNSIRNDGDEGRNKKKQRISNPNSRSIKL